MKSQATTQHLALSKKIVAETRSYIGTPYRHQGRLKNIGIDCAGIVENIAIDLNLAGYGQTPDTRARLDYDLTPDGTLEKLLDHYLVPIYNQPIQTCDVALFAWSKRPQHVGIFTSQTTLVHAYRTVKCVVEVSYGEALKKLTRKIYRFPELV